MVEGNSLDEFVGERVVGVIFIWEGVVGVIFDEEGFPIDELELSSKVRISFFSFPLLKNPNDQNCSLLTNKITYDNLHAFVCLIFLLK